MPDDDWDDWLAEDAADPVADLLAELAGPAPVPQPVPAPADAEPTGPELIRCKHCASIRVSPRSTDGARPRVQFSCRDCGRYSVVDLVNGYEKAWVRMPAGGPPSSGVPEELRNS